MKKNIILSIIILFLLVVIVGLVYALNSPSSPNPNNNYPAPMPNPNYPTPTNNWHDVYGNLYYMYSTPGTNVIIAKNQNGVVCGTYTLASSVSTGKYGFMHIYADDPTTTVIEGARPNDVIYFYINNIRLSGNLTWKGDREITNLNLSYARAVPVD